MQMVSASFEHDPRGFIGSVRLTSPVVSIDPVIPCVAGNDRVIS